MKKMRYKGYKAAIEYNYETDSYYSLVVLPTDVVTFNAETVEELEREFRYTIQAYLSLKNTNARV